VRGGLSDVLTEEGARSFLELCQHAEYVNVGDAAHMVAGDSNNAFSSAIIEFLTRSLPAEEPSSAQRSHSSLSETPASPSSTIRHRGRDR
jgi:hypothetical protein